MLGCEKNVLANIQPPPSPPKSGAKSPHFVRQFVGFLALVIIGST